MSAFTKHNSPSLLRGFLISPDFIDFGILCEGHTYSYPVELKNIGIDSCRFRIAQPPLATGLKVMYKPGPVSNIKQFILNAVF